MKRIPACIITNGCGKLARMTVRGLDTFVARIDRLHTNSNATAKRAVHAGAKVVADKIRKNLTGVTVIPKWQKKDLLDSFGISPVDVDEKGATNTKIGFDGYGSRPTKKYPKGLPNQLLARAIESGTSFRKKQPFVRPAVDAAKKQAINETERVIDEEVKKILKE